MSKLVEQNEDEERTHHGDGVPNADFIAAEGPHKLARGYQDVQDVNAHVNAAQPRHPTGHREERKGPSKEAIGTTQCAPEGPISLFIPTVTESHGRDYGRSASIEVDDRAAGIH